MNITKELINTCVQILIDPYIIRDTNPLILEKLVAHWEHFQRRKRLLEDINENKILVVGDIHGDLDQLRKALTFLEEDKVDHLILNGDLIDRGPDMIECIGLVMSYNLMFPNRLTYLRGNHELSAINTIYGFRGYTTGLFGTKVYNGFTRVFQQLPVAVKIGDWGFVTHGGIPRDPIYFHMMRLELKQPEPESGPYYELIWNDPDDTITGFGKSWRGDNIYNFGKDVFKEFMEFHQLELFLRAHQAFDEGFRWFFDNQLLSLFSSKAGPYANKDPHFALLKNKRVELIKSSTIEY